MPTVSMTQAADLVGKSKGTLSKALKSGKLSYAEKTANGYLIELSELYRVFPAKPSEVVSGSRSETPDETAKAEADALRRELAMVKQSADDLRGVVDDLRADRDAWRDQAQRLLLEGPREVSNRAGWRFWKRSRETHEA